MHFILDPKNGTQRLRQLQTIFHILSAGAVYYVTWVYTQNTMASLVAGLLYAFYGTSPDLVAGSFNFEQFYIPFILSGLALIESGPEMIFLAGICFGLASLAKITALIYAPVLLLPVAISFGIKPALIMGLGVAIPVLISILTDWKLGYMDTDLTKTKCNAVSYYATNRKDKKNVLQYPERIRSHH